MWRSCQDFPFSTTEYLLFLGRGTSENPIPVGFFAVMSRVFCVFGGLQRSMTMHIMLPSFWAKTYLTTDGTFYPFPRVTRTPKIFFGLLILFSCTWNENILLIYYVQFIVWLIWGTTFFFYLFFTNNNVLGTNPFFYLFTNNNMFWARIIAQAACSMHASTKWTLAASFPMFFPPKCVHHPPPRLRTIFAFLASGWRWLCPVFHRFTLFFSCFFVSKKWITSFVINVGLRTVKPTSSDFLLLSVPSLLDPGSAFGESVDDQPSVERRYHLGSSGGLSTRSLASIESNHSDWSKNCFWSTSPKTEVAVNRK